MVPVVEKISLSNNNSKIAKNRSSGRPSEIRPEDLIFIFLFRLYVGETIERISCYFGISCSWICRILASVTVAISCKLKPELKIFSGQELQDRTIERTKLNFPNQDVCITPCLYYSSPSLTSNYIYFLFSAKVHVLDTTYVYFDRPSNVEAQRLSFCPNKQRNLIKVLTLSTTNGTGEAVDFAWGSESDQAILKKTTLFDPITTKAMVLGDKGFSNVSSKKNVTILTPTSDRHGPLTEASVTQNLAIASSRVVIEQYFQQVKRFGKFKNSQSLELNFIKHLKNTWEIIMVLVNRYTIKFK